MGKQRNLKRKRQADRMGGSGRGFTKKTVDHAKKKQKEDQKKQAQRLAEKVGPEPAADRDVLPGIKERAYLPELGRQGSGEEVSDLLNKAQQTRSEVDVTRTDRPGKIRTYKPAGALEFAHGQLRIDILLALRWGIMMGLISANALLDDILKRVPGYLKTIYGAGLDVIAACLHVPNPFLEDALATLGWRGSIPNPGADDKIGAWNLHIQIYMARVLDRQFQTGRHLFSHATNSVISSMQLRELAIDLDEHRAGRFRAKRSAQYSLWISSDGTKGRELPPKIHRAWRAGKLTTDGAVAKAVEADLLKKSESFEGAKLAKSLKAWNTMQVKAAEDAQAIDLVLARWFTEQLEQGLRALDPRYGVLIDKARKVFPELKRRQAESGHRILLNEILTIWEREERKEDERIRFATAQAEKDEAVESERQRGLVELTKARSVPPTVVVKEVVREKLVPDLRLLADNTALLAKVAALEARLAAPPDPATDVSAKRQASKLAELMQIITTLTEIEAGREDNGLMAAWIDLDLVDIQLSQKTAKVGRNFATALAEITDFPAEVAWIKAAAARFGFVERIHVPTKMEVKPLISKGSGPADFPQQPNGI